MLAFFKIDSSLLQFVTIYILQRASVGKKNIISFLFCQQSSSDTTFAPSQYYHFPFHLSSSFPHLHSPDQIGRRRWVSFQVSKRCTGFGFSQVLDSNTTAPQLRFEAGSVFGFFSNASPSFPLAEREAGLNIF